MIGEPTTVLDYSDAEAAPLPPRRARRRWVWLVVSLPALVVPFVPLACDASPGSVVLKGAEAGFSLDREDFCLVLLAIALIGGMTATLLRARVLFWRRAISAGERLAAFVIGLIMAGCAATTIGLLGTKGPFAWEELWMLGIPALLLATGTMLWLRRRRQLRPEDAALAALLVGYVPSAGLTLLLFFKDRQIGWFLTLTCALAATIEAVTLLVPRRQSSA
jgi:hypothetical protein